MLDESDTFLSVTETAKLLGISVPTLRKMRFETTFGNLEIQMGKRSKFSKKQVIKYLQRSQDENVPWIIPKGQLAIVSTKDQINLEVQDDLFDLRGLEYLDPYGTLSLLTHLIGRSRNGQKSRLLLSSTNACKKLEFVGFFNYLEQFAPLVQWNHEILKGGQFFPPDSLLPITLVERKGEERNSLEKLYTLFIQQGFSEDIGGYTGWLLGELADNSLTHGGNTFDQKKCFIQAQRYTLGEDSKCVIIGIADLGQGIQNSLRGNPKYSQMNSTTALLSAFRPKVSSWGDEYNRGKGLTDIISILMGNKSLLRVSSCNVDFEFNFQNESEFKVIKVIPPLFNSVGTRFGFLYIDHKFSKKSRDEANDFIIKEIAIYDTKDE